MAAYDFDILVVGGGLAGFSAAVTANAFGKKTALVERSKLGGNCTLFTCLPSKALVRASHAMSGLHEFPSLGLPAAPVLSLKTGDVLARVRDVVEWASQKDGEATFERIGIRVLYGETKFIDRHRLKVGERVVSASRFIVATGSRPFIPPVEGLNQIPYLTTETLYNLDKLPSCLIILGGGPDGLEFASACAGLGTKVTVVEMAQRLLQNDDQDLVEVLVKSLTRQGVSLLTGTKAVKFTKTGSGVLMEADRGGIHLTLAADAVLVVSGRKANVEGLDFDKAGVRTGPKGILVTDTLRTTAHHIYACGDVVGPFQLASMAEYQGIIAARNALLPFKTRADYRNLITVTFTDPPLANSGLTEAEARARHGNSIHVYSIDFGNVRRARVDGKPAGLAKFICDRRGRLLGAHIIGETAGEVIHEAHALRTLGQPLWKLHNVAHAYPTYSHALVGRAGQLAYLDRMRGNLFVRLGLKLLPGFRNQLNIAVERLAEKEDASRQADLSVTLRPTDALTEALICFGKMDSSSSNELLDGFKIAHTRGAKRVVIDLSAVTHFDLDGAGLFVKLCSLAAGPGMSLSIVGGPAGLTHALRLTGLAGRIPVNAGPIPGTNTDPLPEAWAAGKQIRVKSVPPGALNLNLDGRQAIGPIDGFGPMWEKTYRIRLADVTVTPETVLKKLSESFTVYQPPENRFYPSGPGIRPGEPVIINARTPAGLMATGVLVIYQDKSSFAFITPQGHPEAGWVSFRTYLDDGVTVLEITSLARASDPLYEIAFRIAGSQIQADIWRHFLESVAQSFHSQAQVRVTQKCIDERICWSGIRNTWHNAQLRTILHLALHPLSRPETSRPTAKKR
jgi:pyruvate/2-oxoglutarate dehydrogenase complex dihydrolipoamide dehydrogenase (E3) component/anti-anti-sigma regulatory factor